MHYETLLCSVDREVATVTLNRPRALNALTAAVLAELEAVFTHLADDPAARVILLTGAGDKAFAAGADIAELAAVAPDAGEAFARRGQQVMRRVEACGKPVLALVNGYALGGGCELALACTLRIASETAKFGLPEAKLGILPCYGGTQRLPRLIGPSAALKLMLTGTIIDAAEALRLGLVDEVVAPEHLLARGDELAREILAVAPLAVAACLEAVRRGDSLNLDEAMSLEAGLLGTLSRTADKLEGTAAFLARRTPQWTGR